MSLNLPKKPKTDDASSSSPSLNQLQQEFAQVKRYLLDCPLSETHPAVQAALKGLDQELRRRERDAKLQSKFMNNAVTIEKPPDVVAEPEESTTAPSNKPKLDDDDQVMTDDWHDVAVVTTPLDGDNHHYDCSFLGQRLAKASIATMAEHGVGCQTPLEALALALHAAMRSKALGFACTGVPDDTQGAQSGFAAPIRELPPTRLLPAGWNSNSDKIALRYRKNGTGSFVLEVQLKAAAANRTTDSDAVVQVSIQRSNVASEPTSDSLVFPLHQHFNLDSWKSALVRARGSGEAAVSPALHYKALSTLLTNFCQQFDLGPVAEEEANSEVASATVQHELPYVDTTILNLPTRQQGSTTGMVGGDNMFIPSSQPPMRPLIAGRVDNNYLDDGSTPTTVYDAFPGLYSNRPSGGDFGSDLLPGGGSLIYPHNPLGGGGNLMGPNHPAFIGGAEPPRHGLGMRPRYDPPGPPPDPDNIGFPTVIPPGVLGVGNRKQHPGEPNPDHLRPPNDLNNNGNMFL